VSKTKKRSARDDEEDEDYDDEGDYDDDDEDYEGSDAGSGVSEVVVEATKDDPDSDEIKYDVLDLEKSEWDMLTALHSAVLFGHEGCVTLLLKHGASASHNLVFKSGVILSNLYLASFVADENRAVRITTALLEAGARASTTNEVGDTVVHVMARAGLARLTELLLKVDPSAVASVNLLNRNKESPLALACRGGHLKVASALLKQGAVVTITEEDVKTWAEQSKVWMTHYQQRNLVIARELESVQQAITLAVDANNPELVQALIVAGADCRATKAGVGLLDVVDEQIKAKEQERQNRYTVKANEQARKKAEKEKQEQQRRDLEELGKQADKAEIEARMTYLQYLTGDTSEKKEQALLSSLLDDDEKKRAQEEDDNNARLSIRKLLIENGAQNSAWLTKTSYLPLPHPKIKAERLNSQLYERLFEAAWSGDVGEIEELTLRPPKGTKPALVCVRNYQNHTPLTIAAMRNHPACVKRLIEISELQYVPYVEKPKDVKGEEVKINNLDLARGMEVYQPGSLVGELGDKASKVVELTLQEYDKGGVKPPQDVTLTSPTSAADFLLQAISVTPDLWGAHREKMLDSAIYTGNAVFIATFRGYTGVIEAIFSAIRALDHGLGPRESGGAVYTTNELRHLLAEAVAELQHPHQTYLCWMLALGDLAMAELFIKNVGTGYNFSFLKPRPPKDAHDDDDGEEAGAVRTAEPHYLSSVKKGAYSGMAVEGKRLDWNTDIVPFSVKGQPKPFFPIHYAAYYGNTEAVDFLLGRRATELLKEYLASIAFAECDGRVKFLGEYAAGDAEVAARRLFGLESVDLDGGRNVFHYAAKNNQGKMLAHLAARAKEVSPELLERLINQRSETKLSPLFFAAIEGFPASLTTLLDLGADPAVLDDNMRSVVDFAAVNGLRDLMRALIAGIRDEKTLTKLLGNKGQGTPLLLATLKNDLKMVRLLIRRKAPLLDLQAVDGNKDSVLHVAAKTSNVPLLRLFLRQGGQDTHAWVSRENASGLTPLDIARKQFSQTLETEKAGGPKSRASKRQAKKGPPTEAQPNSRRCYEILARYSGEAGGKGARDVATTADVFKSFETKNADLAGPRGEYILKPFAKSKMQLEEEERQKEKQKEETEDEEEGEGDEDDPTEAGESKEQEQEQEQEQEENEEEEQEEEEEQGESEEDGDGDE